MATFKIDSFIGTGPFDIFVREENEPETVNRYVSGELPNVITFDAIPDGVSHNYIVTVKSPSCNDLVIKFPLLVTCAASPVLLVQQDCTNFAQGDQTVPIKVKSTLSNSSNVLIKVYDGSTLLQSEVVSSGVEKTYIVPNNKDLKIRSENPLYPLCNTEVFYHTLCTFTPDCDYTFTIQNPTPDTIVSVTPPPTITSASFNSGTITINGTAPCNGKVAVYKKVGSTFVIVGERNIDVIGGNWTVDIAGVSTDILAADLLCSTFTQPSQLSNVVTAGPLLPPANIVATPTTDGVNISYDTQEAGVHVRIDISSVGDTNPPADSDNTNGEWSFRTDDLRSTVGTYSFTATLPDSKQYYARILVYKEGRQNAAWVKIGPFAKSGSSTPQWQQPTSIVLTPVTGGVKVNFTTLEDGVTVRLDTSVQPGVNPDENTSSLGVWRYVNSLLCPTAGNYSITDTGVTDTGTHYVRMLVYGSPKADSNWIKRGPFTKL